MVLKSVHRETCDTNCLQHIHTSLQHKQIDEEDAAQKNISIQDDLLEMLESLVANLLVLCRPGLV